MAFSRRTSFRKRSFSRVSRSPRLRDPQRTKKLEVANFFIDEDTVLDNSSAFETQIYTNLGAIALSVAQATVASPEQRVGQVFQSTWRAIQINGIVMDWGIQQDNFGNVSSDDGHVWGYCSLLTDRIDLNTADAPTPATLGSWSPFTNEWPVAILSTTTPTVNSRQVSQPTRIHWCRTLHYNANPPQIILPVEGALYVPSGQDVQVRNSTINRRLRIRVDDNHGFFIGWAFRTDASFNVLEPDARTFKRWARGQIYYRILQ